MSRKHSTPDQNLRRGQQAHVAGRYAEAGRCYEAALHQVPLSPSIRWARAKLALDMREFDRARSMLEQLVREEPAFGNAWHDLGETYRRLDRFEEAARAFQRALAFNYEPSITLALYAYVAAALGRHQEVRSLLLEAAALETQSPKATYNRGLARLMLGSWTRGFLDYVARETCGMVTVPGRASQAPGWDGRQTPGTVVVLQEQGYGDAIQMARFLAQAAERCGRLVTAVPAPLVRLFTGQWPGVEVHSLDGEDIEHHFRILPMSLPLVTSPIPSGELVPYLQADRFPVGLEPAIGRRIAICWHGNPDQGEDRTRSMALTDLLPAFEGCDAEIVSVQVPATEAEKALLAERWIRDLSPGITDFADTAAILARCDLVVTVDTSIAHLAGALGRPTVLLRSMLPDWRWGLAGETTPWYPTIRMIRQSRAFAWEPVIQELRAQLATPMEVAA